MQYAILCYHDEATVGSLTEEEDAALMAELEVVRRQLEDRLGPVARLMPTTAATTVRAGAEPLVIDGPFAETKEQLLGFYVIDCATLEEAIEAARLLTAPRVAAGLKGALEIRPISIFVPGSRAA
ncbi:MAG: YciI family protein [Geminicoccaceae bacterium]